MDPNTTQRPHLFRHGHLPGKESGLRALAAILASNLPDQWLSHVGLFFFGVGTLSPNGLVQKKQPIRKPKKHFGGSPKKQHNIGSHAARDRPRDASSVATRSVARWAFSEWLTSFEPQAMVHRNASLTAQPLASAGQCTPLNRENSMRAQRRMKKPTTCPTIPWNSTADTCQLT